MQPNLDANPFRPTDLATTSSGAGELGVDFATDIASLGEVSAVVQRGIDHLHAALECPHSARSYWSTLRFGFKLVCWEPCAICASSQVQL